MLPVYNIHVAMLKSTRARLSIPIAIGKKSAVYKWQISVFKINHNAAIGLYR